VRVLLLFLDGVGIGKADDRINPFFSARLPNMSDLLDGEVPHRGFRRFHNKRATLVPVNATLGIPGLPQSGTGQASIFTGVNAAGMIGRHFGPYPATSLRPLLEAKNIFRQLQDRGKSVCFANAFPRQFFEYVETGTRRLTVTTLSCQFAGVPLRRLAELRADRAVSADLTRHRWLEGGEPELSTIPAQRAGQHLAKLAADYDFTLFEYWLTDHAGHSQKMEEAVEVLERFDEFLGGLLQHLDFDKTLLVLISDHGNIEDLSTKSHTRNPVPCIAVGRGHHEFSARIKNLTHITPAVVTAICEHDGSSA
jgi:hypothetical protein